jgi:predicted nucleic acid-binding protein
VFLVDASVWASLAGPNETFSAEAEALVDSSWDLAALDLTHYEIANAVGVKMGMPDRARALCRLLTSRCEHGIVVVSPELIGDALKAARDHGLSAYDAAYVAASRRHGWTLVSSDIADLVSKGLAVAPDAAV